MKLVELDLDRPDRWTQALGDDTRPLKTLLRAFEGEATKVLGSGVLVSAVKLGVGALHSLLGDHFGDEATELAELAGVPQRDVLFANLAYEVGNPACTSFVVEGASGPLHARCLDWAFPRKLLHKHGIVLRVRNAPRGDYALVGFPGLFGGLTGVAPGRFTITVNWAGNVSDPVHALPWRAAKGYWPIPWAVRLAFEEAMDFNAAVRLLKNVNLLAPVFFTVSGTKPGEAVVIERSSTAWEIRKPERAGLAVTNCYLTRPFAGEDSNDEMVEDSLERLEYLQPRLAQVRTPADALKLLSRSAIVRADTSHQVVMSAAESLLVVRVPGHKAKTVPFN